MDEESVGVKLVLKLKEYKTKLKEALGLTETTIDKINSKQVKLKGIEEARLEIMRMKQGLQDAKYVLNQISTGKLEGDWNAAAKEVIQYENGLQSAKNTLKSLQNEGKKTKSTMSDAFKNVGKEIQATTKKMIKYAGALIGARAIYGTLRKAASSYLSADTELSNQLQSTWMALGALLAPIIQWLANIFATAVSYINAFVKALTGVDYIANANAKAIGNQTKSMKKMQDATTGIDELNIISQEDTSASASGGAGATTFEPVEVDENKILKAVEIAKTVWNVIKATVGVILVGIEGIILVVIGGIVGAIQGVWEIIKGIGLGLWSFIKGIVLGIGQIFAGVFNGLVTIVTGVFDGIKLIIQGFKDGDWKKIWEGLKTIAIGIVKGLWTALKGIISGILTFLWGLVAGIGNMFIGVINGVISVINGVIKGLNKLKIPDWVPTIGGQGLNIKTIGKISYINSGPIELATGGIVNGRTLAEIGEAGKEGVVPLTNQNAMQELGNIIGKYVQGNGTNEQTILNNVLTLDGNVIYKNQQKIKRQKGASIMGGAFA